MSAKIRAVFAATFLVLAGTSAAWAHHGWSWTRDEFFELKGRITSIYIGNPHATLDIEAQGGAWRVELAPLAATLRSGFVEGAAKAGDEVTATGHRSRDDKELRMKAVRLTVGGNTYDVYPDRVPPG